MKANIKKPSRKAIFAGITAIFVSAAVYVHFAVLPAEAMTISINPQVEIVTNRLGNVLAVTPLDDDATVMLLNRSYSNEALSDVLADLVDKMVISGFISEGSPNQFTIVFSNESVSQRRVEDVNRIIFTALDAKQLEARIVNQTSTAVLAVADSLQNSVIPATTGTLAAAAALANAQASTSTVAQVAAASVADFSPSPSPNSEASQESDDSPSPEPTASPTTTVSPEESAAAKITAAAASAQVISLEAVRAKALALVPGGTVTEIELEWEDNRFEYDVSVIRGLMVHEMEFHAVTGMLLEMETENISDDDLDDEDYDEDYDDDYLGIDKDDDDNVNNDANNDNNDDDDNDRAKDDEEERLEELEDSQSPEPTASPSSPAPSTPATTASGAVLIGTERAQQIALTQTGGGTVFGIDLERGQAGYRYEMEILRDAFIYDVYVDAQTGKVLYSERYLND